MEPLFSDMVLGVTSCRSHTEKHNAKVSMDVQKSLQSLLAANGFKPSVTVDSRLTPAAQPLLNMAVMYGFKTRCKRNEVRVEFSIGTCDVALFTTLWDGEPYYSAIIETNVRPRLVKQVPYGSDLHDTLSCVFYEVECVINTRKQLQGYDVLLPEPYLKQLVYSILSQNERGSDSGNGDERYIDDSDDSDDSDGYDPEPSPSKCV